MFTGPKRAHDGYLKALFRTIIVATAVAAVAGFGAKLRKETSNEPAIPSSSIKPTQARTDSSLVNISSRLQISPAQNEVVIGFVVSGTNSRRFIARAVGPSLRRLGVADALDDPVITIHSSGRSLDGEKDGNIPLDFDTKLSQEAIDRISMAHGLFPLGKDMKDCVRIVDLKPGGYVARVSSASGKTGVVLLEIHQTR